MSKQPKPQFKTKIFTGIRPTGGLTIANALGAVKPLLDLQEETGGRPMVFVADLHALTDHEPEQIKENVVDVVADYLALGLDPEKVDIFIQSDIKDFIYECTALLSRHITIAELIRIPTLKEKVKAGKNPETATGLLAFYPIIMASDILLQRSEFVPVGDDQQPHIEMTRLLARRFNKVYGEVFPLPKPQKVEQLRIASLSGEGKMSKTSPESAIFLGDTEEEIRNKIKRAQTAFGGEMPPVLQSHFIIARSLTKDDAKLAEIEEIEVKHMENEKVMGDFKDLLAEIVVEYIDRYQKKKIDVLADQNLMAEILGNGAELAESNADETLGFMKKAMGI